MFYLKVFITFIVYQKLLRKVFKLYTLDVFFVVAKGASFKKAFIKLSPIVEEKV